MEKVPINKIIPLSSVDGPGLRTSVFVQKCNIHCLYCHNPETQNLCTDCGICVPSCPKKALEIRNEKVIWDKRKCISCDTCIMKCPNRASPKIEYLTAKEVYERIRPSLGFIRGITTSGGECSLYPEFLSELFSLAKKDHLSCLMDSNGMVDYSIYPELMNLCDGVMLDIKSWKEETYHSLTGFSNVIVKKNLSYLDRIDKIEELRIVYVPGYVDIKDCLKKIRDTIMPEHVRKTKIKLIAFRKNGVRGILENHPSPTEEEMLAMMDYASSIGFEKVEKR